jgi:hypothetical protein
MKFWFSANELPRCCRSQMTSQHGKKGRSKGPAMEEFSLRAFSPNILGSLGRAIQK